MIFDTTVTVIERNIAQQLEDTDIFKELFEAAERRREYDFHGYGGCACHISAPCSYCMDHTYCEMCNDYGLVDHMIDVDNELICENCSVRISEREER